MLEISIIFMRKIIVYCIYIASWNAVLTCFFIDTGNNILQYIETIHRILVTGGIWVNFGPLSFHYTNHEDECSIELSWEEIMDIIIDYGFRFEV
jgi:carnosine N-methyltransferase